MSSDTFVARSECHTSPRLALTSSCSVLLVAVCALGNHSWVQQGSFYQCEHPLDVWFSLACLQVLLFGVAVTIGRAAENGSSWWCVEPHSQVGKVAFTCTWAVLLPSLAAWTALGMNWLLDTLHSTPDCFPSDGYFTPTLCALSQIFFFMGAASYGVFVSIIWDAERCRKVNAIAIEAVVDRDLVERWGQLKPSAHLELCGGIKPHEFDDLPRHTVNCTGSECVICLSGLDRGDHARTLPACGHIFHRACIDLWLLRQVRCPLCAADVRFLKAGLSDAAQ